MVFEKLRMKLLNNKLKRLEDPKRKERVREFLQKEVAIEKAKAKNKKEELELLSKIEKAKKIDLTPEQKKVLLRKKEKIKERKAKLNFFAAKVKGGLTNAYKDLSKAIEEREDSQNRETKQNLKKAIKKKIVKKIIKKKIVKKIIKKKIVKKAIKKKIVKKIIKKKIVKKAIKKKVTKKSKKK